MRAMKTLILGSMLLAITLAGCGKSEMDQKTIDSLAESIASKLKLDEELAKKVDKKLVQDVVDVVLTEQEQWAPLPISEATGSWKVWQNRIESKQMTEKECEDLSGCEVQLGTCQTPVEELTGFTVVELKPTGDQAEFSGENPQYDVEEEAGVTIENNMVTISNKFIAVHDDLCEEQTGTTGLRKCEVWEMVTQHRFTLDTHSVCTVTVTTETDEPFASGDGIEEAEKQMNKCEASQEARDDQEVKCTFQGEVTFRGGVLECQARTDEFSTYKEWLEQHADYKMYIDRQGVPQRVEVPDQVKCE